MMQAAGSFGQIDQIKAGIGTDNYERTVCSIDPDRYA